MARKIEIELTSQLNDSEWSWRAAGARQPKGTVAASLLPDSAAVGVVVKAEVESRMDGLEITAVFAPSAPVKNEKNVQRIELLGSSKPVTGVSWDLAKKSKAAPRGERRERDGGRGRPDDKGRPSRGDRPGGRSRPERPGGPRQERGRPQAPVISTTYRNAFLATLGSQEIPIAEQLLRGGIPAVRSAIDEQNATARAANQPEASSDAIMVIAEKLLPQTSLAMWKDRASSALSAGKETRLRDLRAIASASRSVSLDDEARAMATTIQESLATRSTALVDEWVQRMTSALDEGRIVDALAASARPPEHSTRCPADVANKLTIAAGAAMTAQTDPAEWIAILIAVVASPVRRTVKPDGIPHDASAHGEAVKAAGSVPALAKLLGIRIPPPPPMKTAATASPSGRSRQRR